MPKSRNRNKNKGPRKGPRFPELSGISMAKIHALAKSLDSPELRELYRAQQGLNPDLDEEVEELTKEVQEIFDHDKSS